MLLSLEAISSGYDGISIVRDVTLGVEQGEVVAAVFTENFFNARFAPS